MNIPEKIYTANEMIDELLSLTVVGEIEMWEAEELNAIIDTVSQMAKAFKINLIGFQFNDDFKEILVKFKNGSQNSAIFLNSYDRPQFSL